MLDPMDTTNTGLTFGQALEAAIDGRRIARDGWNGKGMFVFHQVPSVIPLDVIPKMQSLPQAVKDEFIRRGEPISYSNQLAIVKPDNNINGWAPSVSDTIAADWCILD